jgi:intein/homing endonuclease
MFEFPLKKTINSNKFRESAIHFEEHKCYTFAPPGTSEYLKYWEEESKRCIDGYTAPDGDWISGYFYFYLNYGRIIKVEDREITLPSGKTIKKAERIEGPPRFWDYDRAFFDCVDMAEKENKHLVVLKARRKGFSYKGASMLIRNYFLIRDSVSYAMASEAEFLTKDGVLSKAWDMMNFVDDNTAWYKHRHKKDTNMHKRASFIRNVNGVQVEEGYKSEIMGITLKNDPHKARGKAGKLILFEEGGKFPNLKTVWQVARPSVEQDGQAYGLMIAYGTGGTQEADYTGLKDLFYEPTAYNCLPIRNIWDEGDQDKACGFFVPQSANLKQYMDEDGNTDVLGSTEAIMKERELVIQNASDRTSIDRHICEQPLTPAEATLNISTNIFPKRELIQQLATIRNSKSLSDLKQVGELRMDDNGVVKFEQKPTLKALTTYRIPAGYSKEGAVTIWEHPPADTPYGLYVAGCLLPGEKVYTSGGLKNVEDVTLEDKLINKDGEEVSVNALLRYDKSNEPIYNTHMSNVDRPTIYTQEHPLYLAESVELEFDFIKAKDTKEGMWTKYPNFYNKVKPIPFGLWNKHKRKRKNDDINPMQFEDFWWFVGHWLGDGFNNNQGENYTIYNSFGLEEIEYVNKYKDIVTRLFSRNPHLKLQNGSNTHKFEYKQLYLFLEENFGKYAGGKYISEWVKYLPNNLKNHLILGYMDSDGSVYKDKSTIRSTFKSINRRLLNDIQDILFSIGIVSSFNLSDPPSTYNINGKTGETKQAYALRLNQVELKKFADKFSFDYYSRKLRCAKQIEFKQKPKKSETCILSEDGNYIYIKISKIEKSTYTGVVYNFDCETHTFITQYCTGHNCDPYDHDQTSGDSLGSVFIYKRIQNFESWYDTIVAEYTGRPDKADNFYETVRMLLIYYKASLLYENERKGLFTYFANKHSEYLLADTPSKIKDIVKDSTVIRGKGVHMPKEIKRWMEGLIKDWLNEEYEVGRKNLQKIYSEALLEELIAYDPLHGNFDRVIAFGLCMIYREELYHLTVKQSANENKDALLLFNKPLFLGRVPY